MPAAVPRLRLTVVNALTGLNLLLGFGAILLAAGGSAEHIRLAALLILASALLDGSDGCLARRWGVTSAFGAQFDSLADLTSFVVAGGILVYFWGQSSASDLPSVLLLAASALYALAGAARLARYNASPAQAAYFQGVPTTVVAGIMALNCLIHPAANPMLVATMTALLALLMVSVFPYPRLAELAPRCPNWSYPVVLASALINLPLTVGVVTSLYLFSGPFISAHRRYSARAH